MSDYGFGKKSDASAPDLSRLPRGPVAVDPVLEAKALRRGEDLGFVNREPGVVESVAFETEGPVRRRRGAVPSKSVFIKGPTPIIDWFIEFSNAGGHDAYWKALEVLKNEFVRKNNPTATDD